MKYLMYVMCVVLCMCTGCSSSVKSQADGTSAERIVTDARGKTLVLTKQPQKIVTTHVFAAEILLDLVEHNKIAGLTKWVHDRDLSSAADKAADVTQTAENNLESIIKLTPDLVLLDENAKPEFIASLEDMGIKVYVFHSISTLKEIPDFIREIAKATGEIAKGELLVEELKRKVQLVRKQVQQKDKQTALLFLRFGAIGGVGTIYHDVIETLGLTDAYDRVRPGEDKREIGASRILTKEEVMQANPDLLLMGSWSMGGAYKNSNAQLEDIYRDESYSTITAVQNKKAIIFPQSYINCLSHNLGANLVKLANMIYEEQNSQGTEVAE